MLTYAPSLSRVISQQQDAEGTGSDMQRVEARKKTHGLADPEEVGMFRPATPVGSKKSGPTAVSCIPYSSIPATASGNCGLEQSADARPENAAQEKEPVAPKDALYMTGKQQHSRNAPKQPPCPRQLLASASHCELPGDWDWSSLNLSAWKSFSAQAGGCHRNSRTTSLCKTSVCRRPPQNFKVERCWEGPVDKDAESSHPEHELSLTYVEPIPEEGTLAPPADKERTGKHRVIADYSPLVSESEIRSHDLANSHAEEARAVDIRRRRWELYSSMYSTVLPLLKKQIAMGTGYKNLE